MSVFPSSSKYFSNILAMAKRGDPEAQTLVGCCYGHNGKMGMKVVEHDIEKALYWWREAAKSNYQYAMKELAFKDAFLDEPSDQKSSGLQRILQNPSFVTTFLRIFARTNKLNK